MRVALTSIAWDTSFKRHTAPAFGKTLPNPVVAVVDSFEGGSRSHGGQVSAVLRQQLPGVQIVPFPVERKPGYLAIGDALGRVAAEVQSGLKLDALNMSMGTMRPLRDLMTGKTTPTVQPMSQLLDQAADHPNDPTSEHEQEPLSAVAGGLRALQQLVGKGVSVFIAAGNHGPDHVNVFTLAPGVHSVGALTPGGQHWSSSGNNPWVTDWATGEHDVVIEGTATHVGPGTSFSTPAALSQSLKP